MNSSDLRGSSGEFPPREFNLNLNSGETEDNEQLDELTKINLREYCLLVASLKRNACEETGQRQADLAVMKWRLSGLKQTVKDFQSRIQLCSKQNAALEEQHVDHNEVEDIIDRAMEENPLFRLVKDVLRSNYTPLQNYHYLFKHGKESVESTLLYMDKCSRSTFRNYEAMKKASEHAIEQMEELRKRDQEAIVGRYKDAKCQLEYQRNLQRATQVILARLCEDLARKNIQHHALQGELEALEFNLDTLKEKSRKDIQKWTQHKESEMDRREELREQIIQKTARVKSMDKDIQGILAAKKVKQRRIKEFSEKVTDLTCSGQQMETKGHELFAKKSRLQADLLSVEHQLKRQNYKAHVLSQEMENLDRMQDYLASVFQNVMQSRGQYQDQCELRSLNDIQVMLENQLHTIVSECNVAKQQADELVEAVTDIREQTHDQARQKNRVCSDMELTDTRTNAISVELAKLRAQQGQLHYYCSGAFRQTQAKLNDTESALSIYLAERDVLENELLSENKRGNDSPSASLESNLRKKIESWSYNSRILTQRSSGIKEEITKSAVQLKELQSEIEELRRQNGRTKKKSGEIECLIFCRQSDIDSQRKKLNELREERELLTKQIENRTNELKENEWEESEDNRERLRLITEKKRLEESRSQYTNIVKRHRKAKQQENDLADELARLKQQDDALGQNKVVSKRCEVAEQVGVKRKPREKKAEPGDKSRGKHPKQRKTGAQASEDIPANLVQEKKFPTRARTKRSAGSYSGSQFS